MENRFFSLVIIPDNGSEMKQGQFKWELLPYLFAPLVISFFICAFFIIGFHIKLSQEKGFKQAVAVKNELTASVEAAQQALQNLTGKLATIQSNDIAFRKYAYMELPDESMYLAGIGGHVIVDEHDFAALAGHLKADVVDVLLTSRTLSSRINVQESSLAEINARIQENLDEYNSTPSILPTHSIRITDDFGYRTHPVTGGRDYHAAVDIAGNRGQRIYATADGEVTLAKASGVLGNCVKIQHKYGYETLYGHLTSILVTAGQQVKKGEVIGTMGSTGRVTGVHLHYGVSYHGKAVDPKEYF